MLILIVTKLDDGLEERVISYINQVVTKGNVDNISRTQYYYKYYVRNPEIEWSFLASMVSRNAGWNMTDLEGMYFPLVLPQSLRQQMFQTYERANWLIFLDAFPQIMLHELSKRYNTSFFHLLKHFHVSQFMQKEWLNFWETKDRKRLMTALIINEQNVIQQPVIKHPYYKREVFHSIPFLVQDWLHYSVVLFPTISGELYGFSVHDFTDVNERIHLGKKLAWLLFHPDYYHAFKQFCERTEHTGSRRDYEQYVRTGIRKETPFLRIAFPIITHHRCDFSDWSIKVKRTEKWFKPIRAPKGHHITNWYLNKQKHLHNAILLSKLTTKNAW